MKYLRTIALSLLLSPLVLAEETEAKKFDPNCANSPKAQKLVDLIIADTNQQRSHIRCNSILAEAAAEKAKLMQEHGLVMHNLGGTPNNFLIQRGYKLPEYYGYELSNQVEAIAGGYATPEVVWEAFKGSFSHRQHLLGELDFYREQDEIGVAFIYEWNSPHVEYWVVYLTKGFKENQVNPFEGEVLPNKSLFMLENKEPD